MKKILLVLTGGTIGSTISEKIIDVTDASSYKILSLYKEKYLHDTHFDVINPINILSENFGTDFWELLYNEILKMPLSDYEGIIVTHGSDTLSYTCAMMGILLSHIPIPVVFIASNHSLDDERSSALDNFRGAVNLIFSRVKRGVFTVFQNNKKEDIVYLSTRLFEADSYNDEFSSFGSKPFGVIKKEQIVPTKDANNPSFSDVEKNPSIKICDKLSLKNKVKLIHPYPGINYDEVCLKNDTKAVLHYLYHSATASVVNDEYSILKFIEKCTKNGIDFYVASFKKGSENVYSTTREIMDSSATTLCNISSFCAYSKLLLAYNQSIMSPKDFMNKNFFFEILK